MYDKHRYPFPVMWYEGMPLEPTTFQQAYLNTSDTIGYLIGSMSKYNWGVTKLVIDEVYLAEGKFAIKELECSLPDYSTIAFNATTADDSQALTIDLKTRSDDFKQKDLFVFLTIPDNHLAYNSSVAKPRYNSKEVDSVKDLNDQDLESKIYFLRPNYSLTLSEHPPIGNISIPLARVKFTGISYQLSQYAAPTQQIMNSPILVNQLEQMIRSARDKLKYLANKDDDGVGNKFFMMNIARIVFPIEHIVKANLSPYALFAHLIGSLSSAIVFVKDDANMPTIPDYNHLDHVASIMPLVAYMNKALDFVKESYKSAQFTEKDGIYGFILPEEKVEKITIGVIKKAEHTMDEISKWINNAIITTEDKLTMMQDQRVIGAKRKNIKYSDKLDVKTTNDMLLVDVMIDTAYITPGKMLCIMNLDLDHAPEAIELFSENK